MSRVEVKPEILQWARKRAGLDIELLRLKFPKIEKWETGDEQPTFRQLQELGRKTRLPFGYFFLQEPLDEEYPIEHFRTLDDRVPAKLSIDLLDTIYMMQRRQWWMREHLIDQGNSPLPFIASANSKDSASAVAAKMRDALGLTNEWAQEHSSWEGALRALREYMENAGIFVVTNGIVGNNTHRVLSVEDFRGFVLVDKYAPFIFVNNTDSKSAQMFTLAHELAHILYGHSASFDLANGQPAKDPNEQMCNQAAAEFLVPAASLRKIWPDVKSARDPYPEIARAFKVSTMVVARRLLDMKIIDRDNFLKFYHDLMSIDLRKKKVSIGGGDFYINQNLRVGKRFASAIVWAVRSGEMQYTDAYRLTGLWGDVFDKYATKNDLG